MLTTKGGTKTTGEIIGGGGTVTGVILIEGRALNEGDDDEWLDEGL